VTAAQLRAMGVDPSTAAKLDDEEWGLGDDAYVAALDVYHQLHCLNTLRQIAYGDLYPKVSGGREKPVWKFHVDHCVDILMQELQCSGNLNLVTYHWVENHDRPFPIFGINRQCIDFEGLTRWRLENTIDVDKYNSIVRKPPGAKQLRAADDWYKYRAPNFTNPNHLNGANPDEKFIL
jgi:Mycotoxin biosynthesis protein UstYa